MGSVYANTGGYTKKMIVYAMAYIGYSVGNLVGPLTFTADQAPRYTSGEFSRNLEFGLKLTHLRGCSDVGLLLCSYLAHPGISLRKSSDRLTVADESR